MVGEGVAPVRLSEVVEAAGGGLVPVVSGGVPGSWVEREISGVVTTDLLDPRRYLSGGELVLTGLAWWRPHRPQRSRDFVAALVESGVAALAAGEAQLGGVPADLVNACEGAGLPLLRVPVDVSFAMIVDQAARRLAPRADDLAGVLGRHRALLAAATREPSTVRPGGPDVAAMAAGRPSHAGLDAVLDWVGTDLDLECWVLSATGRLVCGTAPVPDEAERRRLARQFLRAPSLPHRVTAPPGQAVTLFGAGGVSNRATSWIVAVAGDRDRWGEDRRGAIAELVSLVALDHDLSARRSDAEHQLAAALARGSPAEAVSALRRCGLDPAQRLVVLAGIGPSAGPILADALAAEELPSALAEGDGEWLGAVGTARPGELVTRLRKTVEQVETALGQERLHIGVSDAVTGGDGVLAALAEARSAARAGGLATRHRVSGPELLSSHAVLVAAVPAEIRSAYRSRVLGPLLDHDRIHRSDLVGTLAAYLDCSGSWSRCAARLHVHVNTLRYRIERIAELTGRDPRNLADQVDLLLALNLPD